MKTGPTVRERAVSDWQERLALIVDTMREISRQTDPQEMVQVYAARMRRLFPADGRISLSRRGLSFPEYRITRSTLWKEPVNPWKEKDRLPLLSGGLLASLIYGDEPCIIDDLQVDEDDPAYQYLAGQRSLMAIPMFDQGVALNMVVVLQKEPRAFDWERLPETVQLSNLFGRATHNLVLADEVKTAYQAVDRELKVIEDIQRSLLPAELPRIPGLDLAVHYQTSHRAGGDYYDFFQLPGGKWGILIADVSGHGSPAAVLMAITHSIAHTYPGPAAPPGKLLAYLNDQLAGRYTRENGIFVTAFYGIYDPGQRALSYACAGHPAPRIKRCSVGTFDALDSVSGLPLGIATDLDYPVGGYALRPGDQIVFYTDGITEAVNPAGQMFGVRRLDEVLGRCRSDADQLIRAVLDAVDQFSSGQPANDDRTLLVARAS